VPYSSSIQIVNDANMVANSFTISLGGTALALPKTSSGSGSGIYALLLNVFSTGLAAPPSSAAVNPFSTVPLIKVDSTEANSPLHS
jgi:hypothetical protein